MFSLAVWWASHFLLAFLLIRAFQGRFLAKYRLFYIYLSFVLLLSLFRFYVYVVNPSSYQIVYWYTELFSVALGYSIIWEIYTQALASYGGAARLARQLLSAIYSSGAGQSPC